MERALVSAIIVTWNSATHLRRCLEALRKQTYKPIELIHVDNASSDDSVRLIDGAQQIVNAENRGFAAAVNQGIAVARGEFVLLLNPDAFLEPDYVANIVRAFEDEKFGMATGKLIRADDPNVIDSMGIRMTRTGRHLDIGEPRAESREPFGVSGAAAMYTRAFIDDVSIGGEFLDEDFFAYREDADVAWRGRLFGWRALYVPDAVAHHVRAVTPERRRALPAFINMHSVKNRFLLRMKNEGLYLALRNAPFELARDLVAVAAVLTVERSSLPALGWLWKNRRRIWAKRREIQRRRRVSDRALASWFR
ncbi:MAG TPA: glycosyltransferase family 2 protein [Thermoanaerobaculia bacterium]|nr:glycosyltransferase family 2 protein [Thermoanaerobaculia bacterium]